MKKHNNKLIKKLLNLKEDYTLTLEEGKDEEELQVLSEQINFDEYSKLLAIYDSEIYPATIKAFSSLEEVVILNGISKNISGSDKPKGKDLKELINYLEKVYKENPKDFKKALESFLYTKFAELFETQYKLYDKNNPGKLINKKKNGNGNAPEHHVVLQKSQTKEGGVYEEPDITDIYFKKFLPDFSKKITEQIKAQFEKKEPKKEEPKKDKEEVSEKEQELKNIAEKLGLSIEEPSTTPDKKDTSDFQKKASAFESLLQKQNPLDITNGAIKLLDAASECFNVEGAPKSIENSIKPIVKNLDEMLEPSEGELLNEANPEDQSAKSDGIVNKGGMEIKAESEASGEILKFAREGKYIEIINKLESKTELHALAYALTLLRMLVTHPDAFGSVGKVISKNNDLHADMTSVYVHYMAVLFKEYFHPIFYNPDGQLSFNMHDAKAAETALISFQKLIQASADNFPIGAEFLSFISGNGMARSDKGSTGTAAQDLSLAITGLMDAATNLERKNLDITSKKELLNWRKKDCKAAHEAFDSQLKEKLAKCFEEMLKATFTVKKGDKEIEVPISNYMFDVEIPRRFKKCLNAGNQEFEDFIKAYYDESIIKDTKSKILKKYFDAVAGTKEDASIAYKEKDANQAAEDVENDEKDSLKDFMLKNGFSPEDVKNSENETEDEPEEKSQGGEEGSENEKPETNETPKEEGK